MDRQAGFGDACATRGAAGAWSLDFITIFVAALALITGLGMSPALSTRFRRVSKLLSIQAARSLHFLVLCWFWFFIVIHVTLASPPAS